MSTSDRPEVAHMFQGASNVNIYGTLNATINDAQERLDFLRLLDAEVAPNAILNAGGRADPVRCFPGTREEIISRAERWMESDYRQDRRIFWLSGPAGAGKSAIMQTLAENGQERKAWIASFFFFRFDKTRHHLEPIVATLLYQLLKLFPDLSPIVNRILSRDRLAFKNSIRNQFMELIDGPVRAIRHGLPRQPPIVLLIDGLDECDPSSELDTAAKTQQNTLLHVLHEIATASTSPFIVLVASRVESHIEMTFNDIGTSSMSIHLNEEFRPDKDIRLYISAQLDKIKQTHPLRRRLNPEWPLESTIDAIVEKSSCQFIYAATVSRFIEHSPESPAFTMEMVLNLRPARKHSPFAEIDAIYILILSRSKHWDVISDFLVLEKISANHVLTMPGGPIHSQPGITIKDRRLIPVFLLDCSEDEAESYFSDLIPIIQATASDGKLKLHFYHASFQDFILEPTRSGQFRIDLIRSIDRLAPMLMQRVTDYETFLCALGIMQFVNRGNEPLRAVLNAGPPPVHIDHRVKIIVENNFFQTIKDVYDRTQYSHLCDLWHDWFHPNGSKPNCEALQ